MLATRVRWGGAFVAVAWATFPARGLAGPPREGRPPEGVPVAYDFRRPLSMLTFRNPKKLRPLYVCGASGEGDLTVKLAELKALGSFADTGQEMADLLDAIVVKGSFAGRAYWFSACRFGAKDYTCADWVVTPKPPDIKVAVAEAYDWQPVKDRQGNLSKDTFDVKLKLVFRVGEASAAYSLPAVASFTAPNGLRFSGGFTMRGADMKLTGDDAGEIAVTFSISGKTDFKSAMKGALEKDDLDRDIERELGD